MRLVGERTRELLTIITEASLESALLRELDRMGVHGYTITDARGKGSRGVRSANWEASGNIRIEIVCDATTADAVTAFLTDHYYKDYAMILFRTKVEVQRPQKF